MVTNLSNGNPPLKTTTLLLLNSSHEVFLQSVQMTGRMMAFKLLCLVCYHQKKKNDLWISLLTTKLNSNRKDQMALILRPSKY